MYGKILEKMLKFYEGGPIYSRGLFKSCQAAKITSLILQYNHFPGCSQLCTYMQYTILRINKADCFLVV